MLLDVHGAMHSAEGVTPPVRLPSRALPAPRTRPYKLLSQEAAGLDGPATAAPGEPSTVSILEVLLGRLVRLSYTIPPQNLTLPLERLPSGREEGWC